MQGKTFVFFGIIGSGKGTQVELLKKYLESKTDKECVYAGTGEGFRTLIGSGNYTARLIKESLAKGELQPDFLANSMVVNILTTSLEEDKHLITDGYPRTVKQAKEFETMVRFFKRGNVDIVYIELSKGEATKRNLLRGRNDDTKEGIEKRFEEYENNVIPAMNYFKGKNGYDIHHINGEQTIEKVHEDIMKSLNI